MPSRAQEQSLVRLIEDEPGVLELEPETQDFTLAGTEMSGDLAVIERATERTYIDPARKSGPAVCRFGGDRRRDHDAAEERGQDLKLIDPAQTDERAGIGYPSPAPHGWPRREASLPR